MKFETRIRKLEGRKRTIDPRLCIFTIVSPSPNGPVNEGPGVVWIIDPAARQRELYSREANEDADAFLKRVRAGFAQVSTEYSERR